MFCGLLSKIGYQPITQQELKKGKGDLNGFELGMFGARPASLRILQTADFIFAMTMFPQIEKYPLSLALSVWVYQRK